MRSIFNGIRDLKRPRTTEFTWNEPTQSSHGSHGSYGATSHGSHGSYGATSHGTSSNNNSSNNNSSNNSSSNKWKTKYDNLNGKCKTLKNIKDEYNDLKREHDDLRRQLDVLQTDHDELEEKNEKIHEEYDDLKDKFESLQETVVQSGEDYIQMHGELEWFRQKNYLLESKLNESNEHISYLNRMCGENNNAPFFNVKGAANGRPTYHKQRQEFTRAFRRIIQEHKNRTVKNARRFVTKNNARR
jgi:chromosome segregation ATPase